MQLANKSGTLCNRKCATSEVKVMQIRLNGKYK